MTRTYDSTVARIAGNVASGLVARGTFDGDDEGLAAVAVTIARLIVEATQRTEPPRQPLNLPKPIKERVAGVVTPPTGKAS